MGNSAVSKSKRRLSDFSDVTQDLREHESNMREKMLRGDCKDSGLSGEFSSSFSASSEYLSPEPPCESKTAMGMRMATIASGIDINVRKLPTVFRWSGPGSNVYVSGSFNGWKSKIPLVRSRYDMYTIIDLPEGVHQYKFFVDSEWLCDEKERKVSNTFGTCNNEIKVESSDFEVFEALSIDSASSGHNTPKRSCSPNEDYGQVVPPRDSKHGVRRSGPPILPQHLLQVILNKDVAKHCEPALLHEPSHVMINHLYALSIKDGMMIVSATHRYRKKYVTTILYKPC